MAARRSKNGIALSLLCFVAGNAPMTANPDCFRRCTLSVELEKLQQLESASLPFWLRAAASWSSMRTSGLLGCETRIAAQQRLSDFTTSPSVAFAMQQ